MKNAKKAIKTTHLQTIRNGRRTKIEYDEVMDLETNEWRMVLFFYYAFLNYTYI